MGLEAALNRNCLDRLEAALNRKCVDRLEAALNRNCVDRLDAAHKFLTGVGIVYIEQGNFKNIFALSEELSSPMKIDNYLDCI
jgi:hypothetical protein